MTETKAITASSLGNYMQTFLLLQRTHKLLKSWPEMFITPSGKKKNQTFIGWNLTRQFSNGKES